ncbi:MAG TPA: TadE/TadG family type IV pilus assembly protein [Pirellulaceae bacterium]
MGGFEFRARQESNHGPQRRASFMKRNVRFSRPTPHSRKGATAVEFAMIVPVFMLVLFGALEMMRAFNLLHTADNAAYEAARRGIVPGATAADVRQAAVSVLNTIGTRNPRITITPATIGLGTRQVTVEIAIAMNSNSLAGPLFFRDKELRSQMTMEREPFDQTNAP